MRGSVTRKNVNQPPAPSVMAASSSSLPSCCMSGMSSRATYGKRHEHGRQDDAGQRVDDADVVVLQPDAEPAIQAEQQYIDESRHHGRHRERQVDQRDEEALAAKLELGDTPGGGDAEHGVQRHHDRPRWSASGGSRRACPSSAKLEKYASQPFSSAMANTAASGAASKAPRNVERDGDQQPAHQRRTQVGVSRAGS